MGIKPMAQPSYNRESGFTLLELLLVLAVMSIVLVIVYPNLTNIIANLRLHNDALQLAQELRAARTEAIMSGEARDIRFYMGNSTYRVVSSNRLVSPSSGVSMAENNFDRDSLLCVEYCRFHANGTPSQGGYVKLINQPGRAKYVIVSSVVGRVRISDLRPGATY